MTPLVRHPDTPPSALLAIEGELWRVPDGAIAKFRAVGDISRVVIPSSAAPERTDELWRTTCFEVFSAGEGKAYREYNISPSGAWAAYEFDDYRIGMSPAPARIELEISHDHKILTMIAMIDSEFPLPALVGLAAVIEETDGAIRYWATAFAPGKPDFHAAAVRSLFFDGVDAE